MRSLRPQKKRFSLKEHKNQSTSQVTVAISKAIKKTLASEFRQGGLLSK